MRYPSRFAMAVAASVVFASAGAAQFSTRTFVGSRTRVAPLKPGQQAVQAAVVVVGKVIDVDKDTVEVSPYRGAPKDRKVKYRIATVKIDERLVGGQGLTQFRVGFPAEAVPALRPVPGRGSIVLTTGEEGCFFLNPHFEGDFYVQASGGPLVKQFGKSPKPDDNYAKELEEVKKMAKIIADPVAVLKAKDLDDRFQAAYVLLQRYHTNYSGKAARLEPIPEEENKLILALLAELPWQPTDTKPRLASSPVPPCRNNLWFTIQRDLVGFKAPTIPKPKPGDPPVDRNKLWDEATTAYLKANKDKIKIKGYAK